MFVYFCVCSVFTLQSIPDSQHLTCQPKEHDRSQVEFGNHENWELLITYDSCIHTYSKSGFWELLSKNQA